jgi:hypothetical protein
MGLRQLSAIKHGKLGLTAAKLSVPSERGDGSISSWLFLLEIEVKPEILSRRWGQVDSSVAGSDWSDSASLTAMLW